MDDDTWDRFEKILGQIMYYDIDGQPLRMMEWARLFEDYEYRRVGSDHVGPYHISTVWLGLNHRWGEGPPLIFETMVFGEGQANQEMQRYSTKAEALEGHATLVEALQLLQSATASIQLDPRAPEGIRGETGNETEGP